MFFLSDMLNKRLKMPGRAEALPGRTKPMRTAARHHVSRRPLKGPYPRGFESAVFAAGDFRGVEWLFWRVDGVWITATGFAGGYTPNPTFQEVGTGLTGHAQAVLVVFDPEIVAYEALLKIFWEGHDPTQAMLQGRDVGTAYRSAVHAFGDGQHDAALASRDAYAAALRLAGHGRITTEIAHATEFYFAEAEHQQYIAKNPATAGALKGTGVVYEIREIAAP